MTARKQRHPNGVAHDDWCNRQHELVTKALGSIDTRLAKMETHIEAHTECAAAVRKELAYIRAWTASRDGGTKALMWVAGVAGTGAALIAFLWSIFK